MVPIFQQKVITRVWRRHDVGGEREAPRVLDSSERGVLVEVPLNNHFSVNEGYGGVVVTPVFPRGEGQEVDAIVSNVPEGGVDFGELEGAAVLVEVTMRMVGEEVLAHCNSVVCLRLGGLLNL